jgi:poly(A) polymerase
MNHLMEIRLEEGLIGRDAIEARLRQWWAEQPES